MTQTQTETDSENPVVAKFKDLDEFTDRRGSSRRQAEAAHPPTSCDKCGKRGRVALGACDRAFDKGVDLVCMDCGGS